MTAGDLELGVVGLFGFAEGEDLGELGQRLAVFADAVIALAFPVLGVVGPFAKRGRLQQAVEFDKGSVVFAAAVLLEGTLVDLEYIALVGAGAGLGHHWADGHRVALGAHGFVLVHERVELLPQFAIGLLGLAQAVGHLPLAVVGGLYRALEGFDLLALGGFPLVDALVDLGRGGAGAKAQGQDQGAFCSLYHA